MYNKVRFKAVPTRCRTCAKKQYCKSTLDITILELRFVLVRDKMHINHNTGFKRPLSGAFASGLAGVTGVAVFASTAEQHEAGGVHPVGMRYIRLG